MALVSSGPREPQRTAPRATRGTTAASFLLDLAGPELYQRNPFRILGLPTTASGRAVRETRQRLTKALAVGATIELHSDLPLPVAATPVQVHAAFDDLGDPEHRLVHELFWFWETADAACGCDPAVHTAHDVAVREHARALDLELAAYADYDGQSARGRLWGSAARQWAAVLDDPGLWLHLGARMAALDDRRLDDSTLDALRTTLPRALVLPLVQLAVAAPEPRWLARQRSAWQVVYAGVDHLIVDAVGHLVDRVDAVFQSAGRVLADGDRDEAAAAVEAEAIPLLRRVEQLAPPHGGDRATVVCDRVAILLNNCALATPKATGKREPAKDREWLKTARELATASDTRATITANLAALTRSPALTGAIDFQNQLDRQFEELFKPRPAEKKAAPPARKQTAPPAKRQTGSPAQKKAAPARKKPGLAAAHTNPPSGPPTEPPLAKEADKLLVELGRRVAPDAPARRAASVLFHAVLAVAVGALLGWLAAAVFGRPVVQMAAVGGLVGWGVLFAGRSFRDHRDRSPRRQGDEL
ncbi:MAG: hypothetical protein DLM59_05615 [Pseudonocardiales bacterium]|nr:MAG: hypothetical protein DLM59_05615 [Pseudonocardiales bacterium]